MSSVGYLLNAGDRLHSTRETARVLPEVRNFRASLLAIKALMLK